MKKILIVFLFSLTLSITGQTADEYSAIQVEPGLLFHWNTFNVDGYLDNRTPLGSTSATGLVGVDLRITIPSKIEFLDLSIGTILEKCWDENLSTTSDYILNGGGVYAGVSPKIKGRHFGITSLFAVGVLSYKEYFAYYSDSSTPVVDIYEKKSSFGLGAVSSVGLYGKIGRIGINPQAQAIFSGGSNASFLFYGFLVPLTIQF